VIHHGVVSLVGVHTLAVSVFVVNSGSVIVTARLFHARRIPPRVPTAGRYT
jgi:hypothetical protein